MRYTELKESYDATLDEYTVADIDETRRPRLTLKHLNRLRKMRELKKVEMEQRENFYNIIYGRPTEMPQVWSKNSIFGSFSYFFEFV